MTPSGSRSEAALVLHHHRAGSASATPSTPSPPLSPPPRLFDLSTSPSIPIPPRLPPSPQSQPARPPPTGPGLACSVQRRGGPPSSRRRARSCSPRPVLHPDRPPRIAGARGPHPGLD
ncbi:hypothetical protein GQ55_6G069500 [Panicum hallii var. hallii]|uniref:Uncharacterized protein n=1 Tax=Panicum hallii var. hallii TaxID=1504633 RepID=A0A2T7D4Y2_9POAL|nr:hypothetical protein GQ55_6G069500 [Panicum hallii var. hallii]